MFFCSILYLPFYVSWSLWVPCFSVLFCIYHFMYHHDFGPHVFLFCSVFTILCIIMTLGPMFFCSILYLPFYVSSWLWAPCFSVLFCIYHFMYHDDLGSMVFCSVLYLPFYVSSWLWAPCFSVLFCIYHFMYHDDFGPHVFLFCSVFTILCIMMSLGCHVFL